MQGNNSPRFIFTPFALFSGQIYCWAISNIFNISIWVNSRLGEGTFKCRRAKNHWAKKNLYTLYSSMSINLNDQKKKLQLGKQHKFV